MKKTRKLAALLLAMVMIAMVVPATAFASNSEFSTDPGGGNSTRMWNQKTVTLSGGTYVDLPSFVADHSNLAFEMNGTDSNGKPCNGTYTVSLRRLGSSIASMSAPANGSTYKKDWITVTSGYTYNLRVANNSSYTLKITVTWYTW